MSDSGKQPITVDHKPGGIALVALNRPEARNALNRQLLAALMETLEHLAHEPDLRALILSGAAGRAFCAGADLKERRQMSPDECTGHTEAIALVADALAQFPVPTIAAVNGFALAGGAELAIACDLRVASATAVFGFPEVKIGIFPGAGGVLRLPRLVGVGAARDLLFTGRLVGADEALRMGLVDRVAPAPDCTADAMTIGRTIAESAPLAIRALKRALIESTGMPDLAATDIIRQHRRGLDHTRDYAEGLAAFAERRTPHFQGI